VTAQIIARGYRRYEGERVGVIGAMASVVRVTVHRCLGIHRPARTRVFPVLVIALAYVPTLVYVGVTVLGNRLDREGLPGRMMADAFVPSYAQNYAQIVLAIVVFSAFVAPEVLCPDQRNGMLEMYFASPLNRTTYLLAKSAAVGAMVSVVTLGPPVVLLAGYSIEGFGPNGIGEWFLTLARIVASAIVIASLLTAVSLAMSSLTSRRAAASAGFLAVVVGGSSLCGLLVTQGGVTNRLNLVNLLTLPYELTYRIFDEPSPLTVNAESPIPTPLLVGSYLVWLVVAAALVIRRYRRLATMT